MMKGTNICLFLGLPWNVALILKLVFIDFSEKILVYLLTSIFANPNNDLFYLLLKRVLSGVVAIKNDSLLINQNNYHEDFHSIKEGNSTYSSVINYNCFMCTS